MIGQWEEKAELKILERWEKEGEETEDRGRRWWKKREQNHVPRDFTAGQQRGEVKHV